MAEDRIEDDRLREVCRTVDLREAEAQVHRMIPDAGRVRPDRLGHEREEVPKVIDVQPRLERWQ